MKPVSVIDFAVYEDAKEFLGMAKVTMPDSVLKTVTVNGAGIAGDLKVPVLGQKEAQRATFEFIDNPIAAYRLAEERVHLLTLRVAHQSYDATKGIIPTGQKYVLSVYPISKTGGEVAPAGQQSVTVEVAVLSRQDFINGTLVKHESVLGYLDVDSTGKNRLDEVKGILGKK